METSYSRRAGKRAGPFGAEQKTEGLAEREMISHHPSHVLSASGESPRAIRACSFAGALIFVPATQPMLSK